MDVFELAAVGELSTGIDFGRQGKSEVVTSTIDTGDAFAIAGATITCPPGSVDIKILQGEADRIKLRMARGAGFGFRMLGDQFADGCRSANVRLDGRNSRRGRSPSMPYSMV